MDELKALLGEVEGYEHLHWLNMFVAVMLTNGPVRVTAKALEAAPRLSSAVGSIVIEYDPLRDTYTFSMLDAPSESIPYAGD